MIYNPPHEAASVEFNDDPATHFFLLDMTGFLSNRVTPVLTRAPGQRGDTLLDATVNGRTMGFTAWVSADDDPTFWANREALASAFIVEPAEDAVPQKGTLTIYRGAEPAKEIDVIPIDSPNDVFLSEWLILAEFEMFAPFPYFRGVADEQITFSPGGGFEFSMEFPLEIGAAITQEEVTNVGTVETPLYIRIDGEVEGPRIENLTTGKVLELNISLATGEYVIIDTSYGNKSITRYPGGTNEIATLTLAYADFFGLRPGANELKFSATSMGNDAVATITWRPLWAGI